MQKLLRKGLSGLALLAMVVIYILNQQADGSEQGDYYLLALSWTPSWCDAEGDARGAPQCDDGTGWAGAWSLAATCRGRLAGIIATQMPATPAAAKPAPWLISWAMTGWRGISGKSMGGAAG